MASVIEPAADEYWDAVGSEVDAKGGDLCSECRTHLEQLAAGA